MVPADDDRSTDFARLDQMVDHRAKTVPLAVAQPADPRGKPLELHLFLGLPDPSLQCLVLRKLPEHGFVRFVDIFRVSRQRGPAEGSLTGAEQRPDILRNKTRNIERLLHSSFLGLAADVVSVIKSPGPPLLELEHGFHVHGHRLVRPLDILVRILLSQLQRLLIRKAVGNIPVELIMGRSLVG